MVTLGMPDKILTELSHQKVPAGDKYVLCVSTFREKFKTFVNSYFPGYLSLSRPLCLKLDNTAVKSGTFPCIISMPQLSS